MKKSLGSLLLGKWDTPTVVAVAIGAALFGVLMNYGSITVFTNTRLTTAMLVPVIVGGLFGALPAAVACFFGNVFADLLGGWGYWFDWSTGNAVLGFLVGMLPVYGANIKEGKFDIKHAAIFAVVAVLANMLAFGVVTPIMTVLLYGGELTITFMQSFAATLSNITVLVVAGIPLLFALAKRYAKGTNLSRE